MAIHYYYSALDNLVQPMHSVPFNTHIVANVARLTNVNAFTFGVCHKLSHEFRSAPNELANNNKKMQQASGSKRVLQLFSADTNQMQGVCFCRHYHYL